MARLPKKSVASGPLPNSRAAPFINDPMHDPNCLTFHISESSRTMKNGACMRSTACFLTAYDQWGSLFISKSSLVQGQTGIHVQEDCTVIYAASPPQMRQLVADVWATQLRLEVEVRNSSHGIADEPAPSIRLRPAVYRGMPKSTKADRKVRPGRCRVDNSSKEIGPRVCRAKHTFEI
jgi:hypothetical protein